MEIENPFTGIDGRPCANCDAIVDGERGTLVEGGTELGDSLGVDAGRVDALCADCRETLPAVTSPDG